MRRQTSGFVPERTTRNWCTTLGRGVCFVGFLGIGATLATRSSGRCDAPSRVADAGCPNRDRGSGEETMSPSWLRFGPVARRALESERGDILEMADGRPAKVEVLARDGAMRVRDFLRKLVGCKLLFLNDLAGRQGFKPRQRGPEAGQTSSVMLGRFVFHRKIAQIVGPSPVGNGPFVRNPSSVCQAAIGA